MGSEGPRSDHGITVRQVCISEELLAGSYEDAVKSLNQWLDELENLINDLQASVCPRAHAKGPWRAVSISDEDTKAGDVRLTTRPMATLRDLIHSAELPRRRNTAILWGVRLCSSTR